jgi:UDP-glucose 4-epimerase/UDP-glucuronate decarboxylase
VGRVLILGGGGFIGYHLARRLVSDEKHEITLVDDLSRGRMDPELSALVGRPDVRFVAGDLTDRGTWAALPHGWEQVYMLAAVVGVRHAERDPLRVIRVNTLAVLELLEWLRPEDGVLFFASTSETYASGVAAGTLPVPTPEGVPLSVGEVTNPRFSYAASKILGEAAIIHGAPGRRVPFVIGRFHNVYGPRMGADHVIPELSLRALQGADPFTVFGPEQERAFCHVADAVDAVLRLMASPAAHGAVVNVGNDKEVTRISDLAALILRLANRRPRVDPRPAPAGSVARRCPDLERLRRLTGVQPRVPLEDGVRETLEWYRAWLGRGGGA